MKTARCQVCVLWMFLALASPALAADGWSWSKLNPFSSPSQSRTSASARDGRSGESMGLDLTPDWMNADRRTPKGPSTWDKFTGGTKRFFARTNETLNPWASPAPKSSVTGTRRVYPSSNSRKREKPSLFSSWFQKEEPRREINSVNDFLALPRVEP